MLKEILQLADGIEADAVPGRAGPRRRNRTRSGRGSEPDGRTSCAQGDGAGGNGERRLLMVGGHTARGGWTWLSPEAEVADRAVPGPWSLTLLLRGRPADGSSP